MIRNAQALDLPPGVVAATFIEPDRQRADRLERENHELRSRNTTLRNQLNELDARRQRAESERDVALAHLDAVMNGSDLK